MGNIYYLWQLGTSWCKTQNALIAEQSSARLDIFNLDNLPSLGNPTHIKVSVYPRNSSAICNIVSSQNS